MINRRAAALRRAARVNYARILARMGRWLLIAGWTLAAPYAAHAAQVALIELDGPIGPASSSYVAQARAQAVDQGAAVIVLRLDTPGGLDVAMRDIVKTILASPVPVICWVGPGGARAASAGTYVLYACHVAAMAPGTNLGAATPIPLGGSWPSPKQRDDTPAGANDKAVTPEKSAPEYPDAAQTKTVNDAVAYLRSLAEQRGRNADWAEEAVRGGASLSAQAALQRQVIDLLATDVDDLLRKCDGRAVQLASGTVNLSIGKYELRRLAPGWRLELLAVIGNPTVAYLLLLVGIYGLLLEGYHPGAILPGVVGAISLLLAAYALQMLPVNYAGLALILLGIAMVVAETFTPTFGLLGLGGIVAFVFGSVLLMDTDVPGYRINLGVIAGIAFSSATLFSALLWLLWRARHARVVTGGEALIGATVCALETIETEGWAEIRGERWRVNSTKPLRTGQQARVLAREGLTLRVEPQEP
jgi:membrane-bound serine protease (ClpP class)